MGIANVINKKIDVVFGKDTDTPKTVYFLYNMGAAAKLSEHFGGVYQAQMAFNKVCFNQVGNKFEPKDPNDLLSKEFFDTVKIFMDAMLLNYYRKGGENIDFFDLSITELGAVVTGIVQVMGVGSPEVKEEAGNTTATPPKP